MDGFGEVVMACNMPEPCLFPFVASCQKRFLWTHKETDLALHPVVALVLQVGDANKFPQVSGFTGWIFFFFRVSKQGAHLIAIEEEVIFGAQTTPSVKG